MPDDEKSGDVVGQSPSKDYGLPIANEIVLEHNSNRFAGPNS
jgi:hypothetical protein